MTEPTTEGQSQNLTLDVFMQMLHDFEAKMAASDADAYVRLGEDGYKGYRILKHGGIVLVGGTGRDDSKGQQIAASLREIAPEVTIRLSELLPDGQIYLLDPTLPTLLDLGW